MNGFPEMPNLKKLFVKYTELTGHSLLPVTALVNASPRLQEFKFEVGELSICISRYLRIDSITVLVFLT